MPPGLAAALLLVASVLWSSTEVVATRLLRTSTPVEVAAYRFLFAGLAVLVLVAYPRYRLRGGAGDHAAYLLLGLLGPIAVHLVQYAFLPLTTPSKATVALGTIPLLAALHGRRVSFGMVGASAVGLAGVVALGAESLAGERLTGRDAAGLSGVLASGELWILYTLLLERVPRGGTLTQKSLGALLYAGAASAAAVAFGGSGANLAATLARDAGPLLYLAIGATVVTFLIWSKGVETLGARRAMVSLLAMPVSGVFLGHVVNGDRITGYTVAGTALVVAALVLAVARGDPAAEPAATGGHARETATWPAAT